MLQITAEMLQDDDFHNIFIEQENISVFVLFLSALSKVDLKLFKLRKHLIFIASQ